VRARLYGSLIALGAVVTLAILVGETHESSCTIFCTWEALLAIAGLAAFLAFCAVAVATAVYEIRRARRGRARDA
jgi:amino acid transporter